MARHESIDPDTLSPLTPDVSMTLSRLNAYAKIDKYLPNSGGHVIFHSAEEKHVGLNVLPKEYPLRERHNSTMVLVDDQQTYEKVLKVLKDAGQIEEKTTIEDVSFAFNMRM
jgi:hypothetical protein